MKRRHLFLHYRNDRLSAPKLSESNQKNLDWWMQVRGKSSAFDIWNVLADFSKTHQSCRQWESAPLGKSGLSLCANMADALPAVWFLPRLCKRRAGLSAARTSGAASSSWCCAASSASQPLARPPGGWGRPAGTGPATPRPSPCSWTWLRTHTDKHAQSSFRPR